ncbi:hypothetical protein BGY98DRAFT_232474 [Russula aff. rugulosa BPL654]|nr:hypothetical protein BGY98DRAFT_232474 [Russula aff. rugulosa BPL654]
MSISGSILREEAARARETKWVDVCYNVDLWKLSKEVRWRSWLSHLSNTQKVPGSNPGRTIFLQTQIGKNSHFRFPRAEF